MAFTRFFFVATASLVLFNFATAASGTTTRTITLKNENTCLQTMNKARQNAKLKALRQKEGGHDEVSRETAQPPQGIWAHVCKALLEDKEPATELDPSPSETYALFKLSEEGDEVTVHASTCSDAVKQWQEGFSAFKDNSPADTDLKDSDPISNEASFLTLYNSGDQTSNQAQGQCSVATCTITSEAPEPETTKTASGLVCSTEPNALEKHKELFTEDVWTNIKNAFTEPQITITNESNCLTKLNAAREEAGLSSLAEDKLLLSVAEDEVASGVSKAVCDTLLNGQDFKPSETDLNPSQTFALFKLSGESGEAPSENQRKTLTDDQCSAAVKEFQKGFEEFKNDSPVDKKVEYKTATSKQVSFVTLYNPDSEAKGQCSVATCKSPKDTPAGQEKTVTGLVCSTSPKAFGEESLFTKDQWNNIKSVLSNSASTTVPSILALATLVVVALSP